MKNILKSFLILCLAVVPFLALADITVNFSNNYATTTAGSTLTLTGTLTNNSSSTPVYITNVNNLYVIPLTFGSSSLGSLFANSSSDSATSLALLPAMVAPGQQYSGNLAKLTFAATTTPGDYFGGYNLFGTSIQGASSTPQAFQTFYVHINSGSGVPADPGTGGGLQYSLFGNSGGGQYPNGPRLIKLDGATTVYWVSANNVKIAMLSSKVFLSYHNKWTDVVTVSQVELDSYQSAKFIRLNGSGAIYKVEGTKKRIIRSSVWNSAGIDVGQIMDINLTDFNSYPLSTPVVNISELN